MMKKIAFLLVVFQMALCIANAQSTTDIFLNSKRPYFIINGKHVDALSFLILNYERIEDIKILPTEQARKFGDDAIKNGAVEITMKSNSPLISLPELLTMFHVRSEAIDSTSKWVFYGFGILPLKEPELLIISPDMVRSVNIDGINPKMLSMSRIDGYKIKPELSMAHSGKPFDEIISSLNAIFNEEVKKNQEQKGEIIVR